MENDICQFAIPRCFMKKFIGRAAELKRLKQALSKKAASFVVINGRRRVGKSRLVKEFSKEFTHYFSFIGLPPEKDTTAQHQLDEFSHQLSRHCQEPFAHYSDWSDAFWALGKKVQTGRVLVFFDEISWMGSTDPTFLGKIKNLWDQYLSQNTQLMFIVCGSASSWIDKNILSSTGFVGRISFALTLRELPLSDCNQFWPNNISFYEKIKMLSVVGGVPKYLEEINPKLSAEENIQRLCFTEGGFLVKEFDQIFSDLFLRDSVLYKKIVTCLSKGQKELAEIQAELKLETQGRLTEYLSELELAGFISRDYTWNIKVGLDSKLSKYRLKDNYLRFYLKYIEKNLMKINRSTYDLKSLSSLPEWPTMMGLQCENLVLNNRKKIHTILGINSADIICENPYFQRATNRIRGCQIDYMIQTKFDTLYICEIKFLKEEVPTAIIEALQEKIKALQQSNRFSCRPVLIHMNGVHPEIIDSDYFAAIINMAELFEE